MFRHRRILACGVGLLSACCVLSSCQGEVDPLDKQGSTILKANAASQEIIDSLSAVSSTGVVVHSTASVYSVTGHYFKVAETEKTYQSDSVHIVDYTVNSYVSLGQMEADNVSAEPTETITYFQDESGQAYTKYLTVSNTIGKHLENEYTYNWDTYETEVTPILYSDVATNPLSYLFGNEEDLGEMLAVEENAEGYHLALRKDYLEDDKVLQTMGALYSTDGYSYLMGSVNIDLDKEGNVLDIVFTGYLSDNSYSSYMIQIDVQTDLLAEPIDYSPTKVADHSSNPNFLNYYGKKNLEYVQEMLGEGENFNFAIQVHLDGLGDEEFYGYSDTDYTIYADGKNGLILMLFPNNYTAYRRVGESYQRCTISQTGTVRVSGDSTYTLDQILPRLDTISTDFFTADTANDRLTLDLDSTDSIDSPSFDSEFLSAAFGLIELVSNSTYPVVDQDSLEMDFQSIELQLSSYYGDYIEDSSPVISYTAYSYDLGGYYDLGSYTLYAQYGSFGEVDVSTSEDPEVSFVYNALMAQ